MRARVRSPAVGGTGRALEARPLGAVPRAGGVELCVWAPSARTVEVELGGRRRGLAREEDGVFAATVDAAAGDDYRYVLDGGEAWPDPCSRFQPLGVRGPSRVVEVPDVRPGPDLRLDELVIYELHVGTFSEAGTFDAVIPRLRALR